MPENVTPTPVANGKLSRKRRLAIGGAAAALVVVGGAVAVGATAATAATTKTVPAGASLDLTGLTLVITSQTETGLSPSGAAQVGTTIKWHDNVTSASGTVVGLDLGTSEIDYIDPATHNVWVHETDVVRIDGGVIDLNGEFDATAGYSGGSNNLDVIGVSGKLAGDIGLFQWSPIGGPVAGTITKPTLIGSADIHIAPAG